MNYRSLMIAAAFSLIFAGTTVAAQENIHTPSAQPATEEQEQTPGLQQTPSGEPMKTASEKDAQKPSGTATPPTSTGPTFPNEPSPK